MMLHRGRRDPARAVKSLRTMKNDHRSGHFIGNQYFLSMQGQVLKISEEEDHT